MATVQIQKSGGQPWGFRLAGGRDFNVPLQVKKVESGSPAAGVLAAGDSIIGIGNSDARGMTHMQAHQTIRGSGNYLQLTVVKGHGGMDRLSSIKPKGPVKFSPWKAQSAQ
ncbi:PDZ and LIM domain protein 1-like [Mytilus edulis]|uniref:PDZ and LIM domain protein 1-like n=1 Tax=Mytilus edulis TaxID=6550 RepID=UPI0039EE9EB7